MLVVSTSARGIKGEIQMLYTVIGYWIDGLSYTVWKLWCALYRDPAC